MRLLTLVIMTMLATGSFAQAQRSRGPKSAVDLGTDAGFSGSFERVNKSRIRAQFYNKSDKTVYLLTEVSPDRELKRWYLPSSTGVVSKKSSGTGWHYRAPLIAVEAHKAVPFEFRSHKPVHLLFVVLALPDLHAGTNSQSLEELLHDFAPIGSYKVSIHENQTGFVSYDAQKGAYPETGTWGGWSGTTRSGLSNSNNISAAQIEKVDVRSDNVKKFFPAR